MWQVGDGFVELVDGFSISSLLGLPGVLIKGAQQVTLATTLLTP